MAKVSVEQLASWRAGQVINEERLNQIFTIIAKAINDNYDNYDELVDRLSTLQIPQRWLGTVETYGDIPSFLEQLRQSNPELEPLPRDGDLIFVKSNLDDMRPNIDKGRIIYLYNKGDWVPYSNSIPLATEVNDGLMSKEDFIKLKGMPSAEDVKAYFKDLFDKYQSTLTRLDNLELDNTTTKQNVSNLQSSVAVKQDQATDIPNYKSKTVEDNLKEVKDIVDFLVSEDIIILQEPSANSPDYTTTLTINQARNALTGTWSVIVPWEKLQPSVGSFIKLYGRLEWTNASSKINIPVELTTRLVNIAPNGVPIQDRVGLSGGAFFNFLDQTSRNYIPAHLTMRATVSNPSATSNTVTFDFVVDNIFNGQGTVSLHIDKVIKDIGMSDYVMSEYILNQVKGFLENNLGIKEQVVSTNVNPAEPNFNGFKTNSVFRLNFNYIRGTNAINVFVGGTKLMKGIEWEEQPTGDDVYSNQIKFLRDIDIDKEGVVEFVGLAMVINSFKVVMWEPTLRITAGEIVVYNSKLWIATRDSLGSEPAQGNTDYSSIDLGIDINEATQQIKDFITQTSTPILENLIDSKAASANVIFLKGTISVFKSANEYTNVVRNLIARKAYYLDATNNKVYIDLSNVESQAVALPATVGYGVQWLQDIILDGVADISVLTATPDEISQEITKQLTPYKRNLDTDYEGTLLSFQDEDAFQAFLLANPNLSADDFEDVTVGGSVDLSNYYNKQEVNEKDTQLQNNIDALNNRISPQIDQCAKLTLNNTFTGRVNLFQNGITTSGETNFNNNSVVINNDFMNVDVPTVFANSTNFAQVPTYNGNPLVYSSQLNTYALKSDVRNVKYITVAPNSFRYVNGFNNGNTRTKIYTYQVSSSIRSTLINITWRRSTGMWLTMNYDIDVNGYIQFYFNRPDTSNDFDIDGVFYIYYYY